MDRHFKIYRFFRIVSLLGNVLFLFWILYNGITENFQGTRPEIISYVGLMTLLVLNTVLIYRGQRKT